MPIRIPKKTIILQREGTNHSPKIGQSFNFTPEEVKEIEALDKDALRKPINEGSENEPVQQTKTAAAPAPAPAPAAAKGGKVADKAGSKTNEDEL